MNLLQAALMDKPSIDTDDGSCAICGNFPAEQHHIVPRSQGGTKGPTIRVCGFGNTSGCHGALHGHLLHVYFFEEWKCLRTKKATKLEVALDMDGWKKICT